MLRPRLTLLIALLLGGCAWSDSFDLREGETGEVDRFFARCLPEELDDARATGRFSITHEIPREEAQALRTLIAKVKNGEAPSDEEYRAAGCLTD